MVLQVRLERVARDIPSYRFAQMIGCDPQLWFKYELGRKPAPPHIAAKVSKLLGKPAEELFTPVTPESVGVGN